MCLLLGASGVGKTLLVKRLQTILPRRARAREWGVGCSQGGAGLGAPGRGGFPGRGPAAARLPCLALGILDRAHS